MHDYKITPMQPLIFRDGKPFGTDDNIADTLAFPTPSTIAGAMRTAWAESNGRDYNKALKKSVFGPLLFCNKTNELLLPTPADSVCLKPEKESKSKIFRLTPQCISDAEEGTDLPNQNLKPVFIKSQEKAKPAKDAAKFWYYPNMLNWLMDDSTDALEAEDFGISNLPIETRTHVGINPAKKTAEAGHLFQTAGLDFGNQRRQSENTIQWGWNDESYSLACQFQEEIPATLRTIGGEARLSNIQPANKLFPDCPNELAKTINKSKAFRLILITPAIFEKGYLPSWIDEETMQGNLHGVVVRLHAVAVPRWQAGTSWDMDSARSKTGKGMRTLKRLAPAGSVYWFEILEGQMHIEGFWLTNISDERENDGYGLTLPGVWHIPEKMKSSNKDQ